MKYLNKSIKEINQLLKDKQIKPIDLVEEAFANIEKHQELNAYITLDKERAIEKAKELENKEVDNLLFGLPIALKDNIVTKDLRTTCASRMLENFIPIYNATVVEKLQEKNMIIIGKTNMDEFAMGSSSRTSYFKAPRNPWNKEKISGGSSGGSAVTIGAGDLLFALGSDTGGSIRQPSGFCGVVGLKPTYGRVSRYGLISYASSLDQIGPITKDVYSNAILLNAIVGSDDKDLTSARKEEEDFTRYIDQEVSNMKIAVPNYFMSEIVSEEVKEKVNSIITLLKTNNIQVDFIDIPYLEHAVAIYQIVAMAEASSNLACFDGVRYGYRKENAKDIHELYYGSRTEGFGEEIKRRIMVGSYLLSGENAKVYYNKALSIRDDIQKAFLDVFKNYDYIIGPTTASTAYNITDSSDDPSKTFLDDILVEPANLAGLPAMNVPIGFSKDKMPIGLHIIGNMFEEAKLYQLASFIEKKLDLNLVPGGETNE